MKKFLRGTGICFMLSISLFCFDLTCYALDLSAESAVLYEPISGRFLYEKNKDQKMPMASTTKIVSAITAIENGNLKDIVTTSKYAAAVEGSSVWLAEGEKQTLLDMLYGMMLSSGNDAAIAVAEHIGGNCDNFAKLMNQTAKIAGAENSNFQNPSGLDNENHYTTAADLAKITGYAMKNETFKTIVATKSHNIPWEGHEWDRKLKNHNKLLYQYDGCDGVKTGFTKKSGRCLVSSATRNSVQLIAVTLKDPDDWKDHAALLDYGFSLLTPKTLVEKGQKTEPVPVKNGESDHVSAMYSESVILPVTEGDSTDFKLTFAENVEAPVKAGDVVGFAEVFLNGKSVGKTDIVAGEDVQRLYVPQFKDYFFQLISSMFCI